MTGSTPPLGLPPSMHRPFLSFTLENICTVVLRWYIGLVTNAVVMVVLGISAGLTFSRYTWETGTLLQWLMVFWRSDIWTFYLTASIVDHVSIYNVDLGLNVGHLPLCLGWLFYGGVHRDRKTPNITVMRSELINVGKECTLIFYQMNTGNRSECLTYLFRRNRYRHVLMYKFSQPMKMIPTKCLHATQRARICYLRFCFCFCF